jgi:hypothetical protein
MREACVFEPPWTTDGGRRSPAAIWTHGRNCLTVMRIGGTIAQHTGYCLGNAVADRPFTYMTFHRVRFSSPLNASKTSISGPNCALHWLFGPQSATGEDGIRTRESDLWGGAAFYADLSEAQAVYANVSAELRPNPIGTDGITFSLWRDDASMMAAAYRPGVHRTQLDRYRVEHTADRSSFTRARIMCCSGTWDGIAISK